LIDSDEARPTRITVNGVICDVPAGRSVAAALLAVGIRKLRESPRAGAPRGAFCMMGVCQECVVHIDGHLRQACMVPVTPGLAITLGAGKLGAGTPGAGTPDAGAT
jgi:D-hydroxyproline dehydrogenase subunit gamma